MTTSGESSGMPDANALSIRYSWKCDQILYDSGRRGWAFEPEYQGGVHCSDGVKQSIAPMAIPFAV